MEEVDYSVELTSREEIRTLKNFLTQIKNEAVDYTKINEILKSKFSTGKCEFYRVGETYVICTDAEFDEVYNEIYTAMELARRYYSGINARAHKYWYTTNQGNERRYEINIKIQNVTSLYSRRYKCKTAIMYSFDAGYRSSRDGFDGSGNISGSFELILYQNGIPVIMHCHGTKNYLSYLKDSRFNGPEWIHRSRYSNHLWFDDMNVESVIEAAENTDNCLWVILRHSWESRHKKDLLPDAAYYIEKDDIIKACNVPKNIKLKDNELNSKLFDDEVISTLSEHLRHLSCRSEQYINKKSEYTKEIVFYTNDSIAYVKGGTKFISIKQDDDEVYMLRFNVSAGKETLSYNRAITSDEDIRKVLDLILDMVSHSDVLNAYGPDLLEIQNIL